jgi:hypothetical protein
MPSAWGGGAAPEAPAALHWLRLPELIDILCLAVACVSGHWALRWRARRARTCTAWPASARPSRRRSSLGSVQRVDLSQGLCDMQACRVGCKGADCGVRRRRGEAAAGRDACHVTLLRLRRARPAPARRGAAAARRGRAASQAAAHGSLCFSPPHRLPPLKTVVHNGAQLVRHLVRPLGACPHPHHTPHSAHRGARLPRQRAGVGRVQEDKTKRAAESCASVTPHRTRLPACASTAAATSPCGDLGGPASPLAACAQIIQAWHCAAHAQPLPLCAGACTHPSGRHA